MSDEKNIDNMSEAELSTALQSEVDKLDGKVEAEPVATKEEAPEPKEAEVKTDEVKTDDADKGEEGEESVDDEGNPYRKRIDRLLRKRDTLEETLAEKEARIKELESKLAPNGEESAEGEQDIVSTLNRVLDERETKSKSTIEKLKAVEDEFSKLSSKIPNAAKRKGEILELAEKNPSLTFEAIDRILAPEDHIDPIERNRKNAKRMDVGSRSRADLESEKDLTKGSSADMEKYLKAQEAAGKLVI